MRCRGIDQHVILSRRQSFLSRTTSTNPRGDTRSNLTPMLSKLKQAFRHSPSFDETVRNVTSEELITNRDVVRSIWRRGGAGYLKRGAAKDSPISSLYRLYHFVVIDDNIELRNELEYFFNKADWPVNEIPDPQDKNPKPSLPL